MTKSEGPTRVGRRAGTKNMIREKCQRQTRRALRLGRRPIQYADRGAVAANGAGNGSGRTPVAEAALPSVYVLANRSGRKLAFVAPTEGEAREKAVRAGLVRKPENATLIVVNP